MHDCEDKGEFVAQNICGNILSLSFQNPNQQETQRPNESLHNSMMPAVTERTTLHPAFLTAQKICATDDYINSSDNELLRVMIGGGYSVTVSTLMNGRLNYCSNKNLAQTSLQST